MHARSPNPLKRHLFLSRRRVANSIYPGTDVEVMGSYRRGAKSGHDVDCLLTNPQFPDVLPPGCLSRVVAALERRDGRGILTDHLSLPSEHKPKGLFAKPQKDAFDDKKPMAEEVSCGRVAAKSCG